MNIAGERILRETEVSRLRKRHGNLLNSSKRSHKFQKLNLSTRYRIPLAETLERACCSVSTQPFVNVSFCLTTTSLWEEMTLIFENLHNTPVAQQENRSRKSLKKIIFTPSSELTGETILFTYEKLKLPWNQGWFENVQKLSFCVFKMCQNPPFISTNAGAFHITCTVIYYEINEKKLTCVSGTILSTVPPSDKDKWFPVSMNVWETLWW